MSGTLQRGHLPSARSKALGKTRAHDISPFYLVPALGKVEAHGIVNMVAGHRAVNMVAGHRAVVLLRVLETSPCRGGAAKILS